MVEADPGIRKMLRFAFDAAGFETAETNNGSEALRILELQPPDAVVLDLSLPEHRGQEVLDRLPPIDNYNHEGGNKKPAWVVISSMGSAEVSSIYGGLGDRFIAKPFDPWDLVRKLESQLSEFDG